MSAELRLRRRDRPRSIFKIPETHDDKARYPIIDVHSHNYAPTPADIDRWVKTMDQQGKSWSAEPVRHI